MQSKLICFACLGFLASTICKGQRIKALNAADAYQAPSPISTPAPGYKKADIVKQRANTADLPSVIQTVERALQCYQALSGGKDAMQPKGLPALSSAVMDFKTTTGETAGFTFSVFVFKVGASREKDVTYDLSFTYSVPAPPTSHGAFLAKPSPAPLYAELVKEVQAASMTLDRHQMLNHPGSLMLPVANEVL